MGKKYGRVLFLKEYASYIKDSMINELYQPEPQPSCCLSTLSRSHPTRQCGRCRTACWVWRLNVTNWQRRQNANNNFSRRCPL